MDSVQILFPISDSILPEICSGVQKKGSLRCSLTYKNMAGSFKGAFCLCFKAFLVAFSWANPGMYSWLKYSRLFLTGPTLFLLNSSNRLVWSLFSLLPISLKEIPSFLHPYRSSRSVKLKCLNFFSFKSPPFFKYLIVPK